MSHSSPLRLRQAFRTRLRTGLAVLALAAVAWLGLSILKAAPVLTEAETLRLPAGSGKTFADSSASAGNGLLIWSNAAATTQLNLPATNRVTVRAKGDQCGGAPHMVIKVDGVAVLNSSVASTAWTDYAAAVNLPAGTHTLSVAFTNDALTASCDRNLRVDKLTFTEAPVVPSPVYEAENASLPAGSGKTFADSSASAGKGLLVWSNATATASINTPAAGRLVVRARGDQCNGAPLMTIKLDGAQVLSTAVATTAWTDYGANVAVAAGSHQVTVSFTNDALAAGCDRNLRVDKLSFTTAVSNPPPPEPPQPIPPVPPPGGSTGSPGSWSTYKGFNFTGWCTDCWNTSPATTSLNNLAGMGANSVALPVYWYQDSKYSTSIHRSGNTTSDAAMVGKIRQAKAKGLKVMIRPIIDTENNGGWRGVYQPSNKAVWFASYRTVINHYAAMAQAEGADILEIGSEFNSLQSQDAEWRQVAAESRARYGGKLTYAANWDVFQSVNWYDAVDLISIDAYFPLASTSEGTLSEAAILSRWTNYNGRNIVGEISAVQARFGKPVLFGELGYASRGSALERPWDGTSGGAAYAPALQQNALAAAFKAFDNKPWFQGMFVWQWSYDPNAGGVGNTDHTPQHKPAEATIRNRFLGTDGPIAAASGAGDAQAVSLASAEQAGQRKLAAVVGSDTPGSLNGPGGGPGSGSGGLRADASTPRLTQADTPAATTAATKASPSRMLPAAYQTSKQKVVYKKAVYTTADLLVAGAYEPAPAAQTLPGKYAGVSGLLLTSKDSPLAGLYLQDALNPTATRSLYQAAGLGALLGLLLVSGLPEARARRAPRRLALLPAFARSR